LHRGYDRLSATGVYPELESFFILNDYPKRRNYPEDLLFKVNLR
jgi:hypothetical protein